MRFFCPFLLLSVFLVSCVGHTESDPVREYAISKSVRMHVELIKPNDCILDGKYLIVHDAGAHDGYIKVVDIRKDTIVNSFLPHGQGPNDALSITSMSVSDGHLFVLDNMRQRLAAYSLDSIEEYGKQTFEYAQPWPESGSVLSFTTAGDRYVISRLGTVEKFSILDRDLHERGHGGSYLPSPSGTDPHDNNARSLADAGKTCVSPDRKHLVDIVFKACAISCYDIAGDSMRQEWSHLLEPYKYTSDGPYIQSEGNLGYKSVSITDSLIYGLYCGKPREKGSWATSGSTIHVYDYNGTMLRKINLDEPAVRICVSGDDRTLYTLNFEVDPSVCIYQLDSIK